MLERTRAENQTRDTSPVPIQLSLEYMVSSTLAEEGKPRNLYVCVIFI